MIQLKDTKYQKTSDFLSNAVDIAEYYGFTSIDEIPRAQSADRRPRTATHANDPEILFARRDERALPPIVRRVLTLARPSHGTLLAWRVADATNNNPATSLELHVMGTNSSIAEALLIVVANAIMEEAGVGQRTLSINNLGGPESSGRYVRDVGTYLRKHLDSITPTLRPRAATDPLGTLIQLIERGHPAVSRAPQSMEYLTEEERHRFWELLEYLETSGLPYELNSQILGSRDFWSHTLFEMSAVDTESGVRMPFALGGRYDPLASRLKRAPEHSAMIAIAVESRGKSTVKSEEHGIPLIYFAHLGSEARRRAIPLL